MRATATAEAGARLADPFRAGKAALGGRDGMISAAIAMLLPLFRCNQGAVPQKIDHFSGQGKF